ncbi:MAG: MFS transporter [Bifidobacteriaceae bacterium]|jgi:DHA1 family arabinose polymer transporter-like MFS transporter|nr:MFS transporter [Bifidobacteriaceae bacterium]
MSSSVPIVPTLQQPKPAGGFITTVRLLSLSLVSFSLGMSQFMLVSLLPNAATALSIPSSQASNLISSYSIGICVGLLLLLLSKRLSAKVIMILMAGLIAVGSFLTFIFTSFGLLVVARFIAGLPHGAFFSLTSLVAPKLSRKGKEARGLGIVVTGQTVANIIGVPLGTFMASVMPWQSVFLVIAIVALVGLLLIAALVPSVSLNDGSDARAILKAVRTLPFWMGFLGVFFGCASIFAWWNFLSSWAVTFGGLTSANIVILMMVAGIGMFLGSTLSSQISDRTAPAATTMWGQVGALIALLVVGLASPSGIGAYVATFFVAFFLFFVCGAPSQLVMVGLAAGGLLGGAAFQFAVNFGNFVGTEIGSVAAGSAGHYQVSALVGAALSVLSIAGFIYLSVREKRGSDVIA